MRSNLNKYLTMILLTASLSCIFDSRIIASDSIPHYYVYIKADQAPFEMEFGRYKQTSKKLKQDVVFATFEEFLLATKASTNPNKKERWLVYIHGLWANQKNFEESTGKILHEEIFNQIEGYDKIISLKWTSALDYKKNLVLTEAKGLEFGKLLTQLYEQHGQNVEYNFLCHSMGNRVFKALANEIINHEIHVGKALLIAADLEHDALIQDLKGLPDYCEKIYSFYNLDDRTLNVANSLKSYQRMGITGPCTESRKINNLIPISTTGIKDNEGLAPKLSLHRYYYSSPGVRKLIRDILNGVKSTKWFDKELKL